jgi:hypothetical protein
VDFVVDIVEGSKVVVDDLFDPLDLLGGNL